MSKAKVYLDTSVIGGCCDAKFAEWSLGLLRDIRLGLLVPVISDLTEKELQKAPADVLEVFREILESGCERIVESDVSLALADRYISEAILPPNSRDDARHIAMASVGDVDILVSWNFKHIVHYDRIRRFNAVNALMGYRSLLIHTPMEVASEKGL